jgi:hypothetical protein
MELPQTETLKVIETEPGFKGTTAAAQTKAATLEPASWFRCRPSSLRGT